MTTLLEAAERIEQFTGESLTKRISGIETNLQGSDKRACETLYSSSDITLALFDSAFTLKKAAGQVNVLIHAVGILLLLPHILEDGELIKALSLGAGNTGRPFDLETDRRVAEFKFINWQGGAESIRQNSLFKDYYLMAEYPTTKSKYLYVLGTKYPLKFLTSSRSLESIMSKNNKLWDEFRKKYETRFTKVSEYFEFRKHSIKLVDASSIIPQLMGTDVLSDSQGEA